MALQQFAMQRPEVAADPVFKLVNKLFEVAPGVLTEHGSSNIISVECRTESNSRLQERPRTPSPTSTPSPDPCSGTTVSPNSISTPSLSVRFSILLPL